MTHKLNASLASLVLAGLAVQGAAGAPIVLNGGFEDNASSFGTFPGYTFQDGNTTIASWTTLQNNTGINPGAFGSSPFAPTAGVATGNFGFLQGADSAFNQVIGGFVIGDTYTLHYDDSTRGGNTGVLTVSIDTVTKATTPSNAAWTTETLTFVATATSETLTFTNTSPAGDNTVNVDNVALPEPTTLSVIGIAGLSLLGRRRARRV